MNRTNIIRVAAAAAALVLLTAGIAWARHDDPARHTVSVSAPGDTTESSSTTTDAPTTTTAAPTTTTAETPVTVAATAPAAPAPTVPACLNSSDPACGPFRWASPPASKEPMILTVSTPTPVAGQPATFRVTVHSLQLPIDHDCVQIDYGDGLSEPSSCADYACAPIYGLWSPPAPTPDNFVTSYSHTYAAAGTFSATFTFHTGPECDGNPYTNQITKAVTVTVT